MIDKRDTQQIIGCLMKKPQLLSEIDKYSFVLTDWQLKDCIEMEQQKYNLLI